VRFRAAQKVQNHCLLPRNAPQEHLVEKYLEGDHNKLRELVMVAAPRRIINVDPI
jgi:hypothetical protein